MLPCPQRSQNFSSTNSIKQLLHCAALLALCCALAFTGCGGSGGHAATDGLGLPQDHTQAGPGETGDAVHQTSATYLVSGRTRKGDSTGISGVTLTFTNGAGTTTSNASGDYTKSGLVNGTYTVTPSKAGWWFSPASKSVTISGANKTGINFVGSNLWNMSGYVRRADYSAIASATVTITQGATTIGTVTTNGSGYWSLAGLPNGTYTVTPTKTGWWFNPVAKSVIINSANQTYVNFYGSDQFTVTGLVRESNYNGIDAVSLQFTNGGGTATSDANGNYSRSALAAGTYTITPSKVGWTFSPASKTITLSTANLSGINFIGTADGTWHTYTLAGSGGVSTGTFTSLTTINSRPAIAYSEDYQSSSGVLKYIRATDANGTTWGSPLIVDSNGTGFFDCTTTHLRVVNGNPTIVFQAQSAIQYVRALDISGTSWGGSITVWSAVSPYYQAALLIANGNPAAVYGYGNQGLGFKRALDASGVSWGLSQFDVNSSGTELAATVLSSSPSVPAVVYTPSTTGRLRYRRGTDASGSAWQADAEIHGSNNSADPALEIVNGRPAIAFINSGTLYYMRANDSFGDSWPGSQVALQSGVTADMNSRVVSMAVIGGVPAVVFVKTATLKRQLWFIQALDANGASWGTAVKIDGTVSVSVGTHNWLAQINGHPAVSYYDDTNLDLKYAVRY